MIPDYIVLLFLVTVLLVSVALNLFFYRRSRTAQPVDFQDLVNGMMDGVWLIDSEGRTTFVNPRLTHMFGMTEAEMMGKTIYELIVPSGIEQAREAFRKRAEGERATGATLIELVNGRILQTRFAAFPVYDRRGRMRGALAVLTDIADQYRMEQQLRQNEERYRTIFENVNDLICATDEAGLMNSLNPVFTHLTGWKVEAWLGRPVEDLVHPDDRTRFQELLAEAAAIADASVASADDTVSRRSAVITASSQSRLDGLQVRLLTRSSQDLMVEIKVQPILKQGKLAGYTCVARDITARRLEALQELQVMLEYERLSMLNRFIRNASHDLRTPLSIINSSAYLVRRKLTETDAEKVQAHLDAIEQQVMHLNQQLDNLFTISEDYVDTHLPLEQYDLNELVTMTVNEITPAVERKHQQLTLHRLNEPTRILCNPDEIQRAIRHILVNASSYTMSGGKIEVRLSRQPGFIAVAIQDNGIGMEPDQQTLIFEPFYRVDEARSLDTGGMGLGLTISRAIVDAHGGHIEVESTPNKGTTFTLLFPVKLGSEAHP